MLKNIKKKIKNQNINYNKILVIIVFIYLFVIVIFNLYIFYKIGKLSGISDISFKLPGQIKLCINNPPLINYSCNSTINQDETFYCVLNAIDNDTNSYFFWDIFTISGPKNINLIGNIINFTPNASFVGNYSFSLTVWDNSNCDNNYYYNIFNLTVINVNDPPIQTQIIPNITFQEDTTYSFDLDEYFFDIDGDPITYTTIPNSLDNILVIIDSNNIVSFIPITAWSGNENISFIAWDPYYANTTSNLIKIIVTPKEQNITKKTSSGSSTSKTNEGAPPSCLPLWYCKPFGKCEPDNLKRRECFDLNNCSTNFGKPNTTEPCIFISTCFDGYKGPDEEDIDCGGPCPPCGNCYDNLCNNNEDCTKGLTDIPDCGGPCSPCKEEKKETCFDFICNNNEDCTKGLTDIPDCGGPCQKCENIEKPLAPKKNYDLYVLAIALSTLLFVASKTFYPYYLTIVKKRKRKLYEEKLLLEAKISESIFESILKLEELINEEKVEKLILLLANIVRKYFKSLFNLRYEFTYEELINEIKSRRISDTFKKVLINFFERSTEIEFSGKTISKEEFKAILSEFKQIVALTSEVELKDKNSEKTLLKEKNNIESKKINNLFNKIYEAENLLRYKKINNAYFIYLRIINEFKTLNYEEKKKINNFILRLYEEIKLAREEYEKQTKDK